jgi:hypothetical protein
VAEQIGKHKPAQRVKQMSNEQPPRTARQVYADLVNKGRGLLPTLRRDYYDNVRLYYFRGPRTARDLEAINAALEADKLPHVKHISNCDGERFVELVNGTPLMQLLFLEGVMLPGLRRIGYDEENRLCGQLHYLRRNVVGYLLTTETDADGNKGYHWTTTHDPNAAFKFDSHSEAHNASINGGCVLGPFPAF